MVPDMPAAKHALPSIVGMQSSSFPSASFSKSHFFFLIRNRRVGEVLGQVRTVSRQFQLVSETGEHTC